MTELFTSSTGLLGSRIAVNRSIFSAVAEAETVCFDEGPRPLNTRDRTVNSLSGSIDTREIDAYAQGVELSQQRRYDAGIFKIWAGEPGHQLRRNRFGMDRNDRPSKAFADADFFDPVTFVDAQDAASPFWTPIFTFPIITSDSDQSENENFNGVIEPLSIRKVANFSSIDTPFEAHAVRGAFGNGNIDKQNSSDQVVSIYEFSEDEREIGFLDLVDLIAGIPLNGFFDGTMAHLEPFTDRRLVRNTVRSTTMESDMTAALSLMTGSTDNYIQPGFRSAVCGRDYDGSTVNGIDSLAFGGMTY